MVTCRRADGREVSLAEFPLAQQFSNAETVRAEEIELSVPDGRRVRTLINAASIRAEDGGVESVVVTQQDLAELLAMVSHELLAPLTSIISSTTTLLRPSPRLDPAEMHEFFRIIDEQAHHCAGSSTTSSTPGASRRARCRSPERQCRWPGSWTRRDRRS